MKSLLQVFVFSGTFLTIWAFSCEEGNGSKKPILDKQGEQQTGGGRAVISELPDDIYLLVAKIAYFKENPGQDIHKLFIGYEDFDILSNDGLKELQSWQVESYNKKLFDLQRLIAIVYQKNDEKNTKFGAKVDELDKDIRPRMEKDPILIVNVFIAKLLNMNSVEEFSELLPIVHDDNHKKYFEKCYTMAIDTTVFFRLNELIKKLEFDAEFDLKVAIEELNQLNILSNKRYEEKFSYAIGKLNNLLGYKYIEKLVRPFIFGQVIDKLNPLSKELEKQNNKLLLLETAGEAKRWISYRGPAFLVIWNYFNDIKIGLLSLGDAEYSLVKSLELGEYSSEAGEQKAEISQEKDIIQVKRSQQQIYKSEQSEKKYVITLWSRVDFNVASGEVLFTSSIADENRTYSCPPTYVANIDCKPIFENNAR